jgi:hypothetical protein
VATTSAYRAAFSKGVGPDEIREMPSTIPFEIVWLSGYLKRLPTEAKRLRLYMTRNGMKLEVCLKRTTQTEGVCEQSAEDNIRREHGTTIFTIHIRHIK